MKCPHCVFNSGKDQVVEHVIQMHDGVGILSCSQCECKFLTTVKINNHVRNAHRSKRKWTAPNVDASRKKAKNVASCSQQCQHCSHNCSDQDDLKKHCRESHSCCSTCKKTFSSRDSMLKHVRSQHGVIGKPCIKCNVDFISEKDRSDHIIRHAGGRIERQAVNDNFRAIEVEIDENLHDLDLTIFHNRRQGIKRMLEAELERLGGLKFYVVTQMLMLKPSLDGGEIESHPIFRSSAQKITNEVEIENELLTAEEEIASKIDLYTHLGSGWHACRILYISLQVAHYQPLRGGSYLKLPKQIAKKKACINIQNRGDDYCLIWSVIAYFTNHLFDNFVRVSKYRTFFQERERKANIPVGDGENLTVCFKGLHFPSSISDVKHFEKKNPTIGVNVFALNAKNNIIPLKVALNSRAEHLIDLLLITNGDKKHFVLIKNLDRLVNKYGTQQYKYCRRCLQRFYNKKILEQHEQDCSKFKAQKVFMPKKDENLKFTNVHKRIRIPHVVYADFESTLKKVEEMKGNKTNLMQSHEANSYCLLLLGRGVDNPQPTLHVGKDATSHFVRELKDKAREVQRLRQLEPEPMDEAAFECLDSYTCCLCKRCMEPTDTIHRHHDHSTGESIGFAHGSCNLNAFDRSPLPLVLHNGLKYDLKLFIREISKHTDDIKIIPNSEENFKTMMWKFRCEECPSSYKCHHYPKIRIVDSLEFVNESLASFVESSKGSIDFELLSRWTASKFDDAQTSKELLLRKNAYPYEFVDEIEKLYETKELPPIEEFYSSLAESSISQEEYESAQRVWSFFKCKHLLDYHNLYLTCDVLLLADCFENFRNICLKNYDLDPLHYVGLPGFAWDAMLSTTGVELELLKHVDMYNFFEASVRGGLSQVALRYARANNPTMSDYDASKPTSWILYLDATSLYATVMTKKLPKSNFRWMDETRLENIEISLKDGKFGVLEDEIHGYTLEVTLDYPDELHCSHSDYALAPERIVVKDEWMSETNLELRDELGLGTSKIAKLIPHFFRRERYILHCATLKLYLELGMKIVQVHRGIEYEHEDWLSKYIDLNAELRKEACTEVQSKVFKAMSNILYGKTVQGCRGKVDVQLVTSWKKGRKLVAKPTYKHHTILDDDLVLVNSMCAEVKLDKPIYAGTTILDYAKEFMYSFYYRKLQPLFGESMRLIMTDTDSLMIYVQCENIHDKLREIIDVLDTSEYPEDHPIFTADNKHYRTENKKKLGTVREELKGKQIVEAVAIKSKQYAFITEDDEETVKSKGIPRRSLEKTLRHKHYKSCLEERKSKSVTSHTIRSYQHNLYTIKGTKVALTPYDDKRYILDNIIDTRNYGHCNNRQ